MARILKVHKAGIEGHVTTEMTLEEAQTSIHFYENTIVAIAGEVVRNYEELLDRVNSLPEDVEEVEAFIIPQMMGG